MIHEKVETLLIGRIDTCLLPHTSDPPNTERQFTRANPHVWTKADLTLCGVQSLRHGEEIGLSGKW